MDFATISEGQVLDFTVLNNIISNQKQLNALVNSLTAGVPSGAGVADVEVSTWDKIWFVVDVPTNQKGGWNVAVTYPAPWAGRIVSVPYLTCSIMADYGYPAQRVNSSIYEVTTTGCKVHVFPNNDTTPMNCKVIVVGFAKVTVEDAS